MIENDCDYENDNTYDLMKSPHIREIERQAKECIETFFCDKKYWAGGPISKQKLFSKENVLTVMETTIVDALTIAYACLEDQQPQNYNNMSDDNWEIQLCYGVLNTCPRRCVPKAFAGGILLVYLSICQGIDYLEKLKEINANFQSSYSIL